MKYVSLLLFMVLAAVWASPTTAQQLDVAALQRALAGLGYQPGPANGKWGVETRGALFQFQRDHGFRTSLDIDEEQRQLLGMVAVANSATVPEPIILEHESPSPIVGDLDTTMQLYARLASRIVIQSFREKAFLNIVTTQSHSVEVILVAPEPLTGYSNIFALDNVTYQIAGIHIASDKLRHKKAAIPDPSSLADVGSQDEAPASLCNSDPVDTSGVGGTHVCLLSGQVFFGGTFQLGENVVSCKDGAMTISNANRRQAFALGSTCSVNGNPVKLTNSGWIEEIG